MNSKRSPKFKIMQICMVVLFGAVFISLLAGTTHNQQLATIGWVITGIAAIPVLYMWFTK